MSNWHGQFMLVALYRRDGQKVTTYFHFVYFYNAKGDAVNFATFGALKKTQFYW